MKLTKRLLAAAAAVVLSVSAASCGDGDSSAERADSRKADSAADSSSAPDDSSETSEKDPSSEAGDSSSETKDEKQEALDKLGKRDIKANTVRILATRKADPYRQNVTPEAAEFFKKKYGAKAEYVFVSGDERYEKLSEMKNSGEAPDLMAADEMDTFPKGVISDLFMPIDDYIDTGSELWKDTEQSASCFMVKDKHYTAVIETLPRFVLVYDNRTVKDVEIDDPYEIFNSGKWDQTAFDRLCRSFTGSSLGRKALGGGYTAEALSEGSGFPLFGVSGGEVVTYYDRDELRDTQKFMYSLGQAGLYAGEVEVKTLTDGNLLFMTAELSQLEDLEGGRGLFEGVSFDDLMFMPAPSADSSSPKIGATVRGYHILECSKDPEAAAAYLECEKAALEFDRADYEEHLKKDVGWNDDMIAMRRRLISLAEEAPVISCAEGISYEAGRSASEIIAYSLKPSESAKTWDSLVDEYSNQLDYLALKGNDTAPTGP